MKNSAGVFGLVLVVSACVSYPDVRPNTSGVHLVKLRTERKGDGYHEAFRQAKAYCAGAQGANAFVVKEESNYVGSMDAATYAKSVSGQGEGLGENFEYQMQFTCR